MSFNNTIAIILFSAFTIILVDKFSAKDITGRQINALTNGFASTNYVTCANLTCTVIDVTHTNSPSGIVTVSDNLTYTNFPPSTYRVGYTNYAEHAQFVSLNKCIGTNYIEGKRFTNRLTNFTSYADKHAESIDIRNSGPYYAQELGKYNAHNAIDNHKKFWFYLSPLIVVALIFIFGFIYFELGYLWRRPPQRPPSWLWRRPPPPPPTQRTFYSSGATQVGSPRRAFVDKDKDKHSWVWKETERETEPTGPPVPEDEEI